MTAPGTPYDFAQDAHVFVAPPLGKLTSYGAGESRRETYGVLQSVTDLVDVGGTLGERRITTLQVVKGTLGDVPLDEHVMHDGQRYRVLSQGEDDARWFDLFRVVRA